MADVFISYSKKDRELAQRVDEALQAAGYTTWWDNNLIPAEQWNQTIVAEITAARVVLVIWTYSSIGSSFVQDEAEIGRKANKLVPVRFEDVEPPLGQGTIQLADLRGWQGSPEDQRWRQVLVAIERIMDGTGMQKAASFGGAFERRLMDIPPFPRPHVPAPSENDEWVKTGEWLLKLGKGGLDAFSVCAEHIYSEPSDVFLVCTHGDNAFRRVWRLPHRASTELSTSSYPPCRLLPLYFSDTLLVIDGTILYVPCHHNMGVIFGGLEYIYRTLIEKKEFWDSGYRIFPDNNNGMTFDYDFENDSPVVFLSTEVQGRVSVFHNHLKHYRKHERNRESLFRSADWSGDGVQGQYATWSLDNTLCLIEDGVGWAKSRNQKGYVLTKQEDSYAINDIAFSKQSVLTLHPAGLVIFYEHVGNDIQISYFDCHQETIIDQKICKGLASTDLHPVTNLSYSRSGRHVAIEFLRFEKTIIYDLVNNGVVEELSGRSGPRYSPDGQRLYMRNDKTGDAEIYDAQGRGGIIVAKANAYINPLWSPTARQIFIPSYENGKTGVMSYALKI